MKIFPICGNPECSPMQPLYGQKLERKYSNDPESGRCPNCGGVFHIPTMTDGRWKKFVKALPCPKCQKQGRTVFLKPKKRWCYKCPKCGRTY